MSSAEEKTEEAPQAATYVEPQKAPGSPLAGGLRRRRIKGAALAAGLILAAACVVGLLAQSGSGKADDTVPTVAVTRGDLTMAVTGIGALWCMQPFEIKDQVEGNTTILEIIDEGTVLTQEDVDNGTVLVRLDSSSLEDRVASDSISVARAESDSAQARDAVEIQKNQNESDIANADLHAKFARLELDRYLGAELAADLLGGKADFINLGDNPKLGGAAQQSLRDLADQVQLAKQKWARATDKLDWTEKLFAKGYVSHDNLTADKLAKSQATATQDSAQAALDLFRQYQLPKDSEKKFTDYQENVRILDRTQATAQSNLTKAEADLRSKEANYQLQKSELEKSKDMLSKCIIRATKPGRVTYGNSADPWQRQENPINIGVSVQQKQTLLQIPDLSSMSVRLNVPEQSVDKLKKDQAALIIFEAITGKTFVGHVARISPMASAAQARLNPDKKVYATEVALDEPPEGFIPGMSAMVQIIVARVKDVLQVPTQAVTTYKGFSFAWVKTPEGPQLRQLVLGASSAKYVEVKAGLHENEQVYLAQPEEHAREQIEQKVRDLEAARGVREGAKPAGPETLPVPLLEGLQSPGATQAGEAQAPGAQQRDASQQGGRQRRGQNMTPEERARMRQQYGGGGGGRADAGGGAGAGRADAGGGAGRGRGDASGGGGRTGEGRQGGGGAAGGGGGPQGAPGQ